MLVSFFHQLRHYRLPVSITEFLALLDGLDHHVAGLSAESFYYLARTALVKDERFYDRFDQAFSAYFEGVQNHFDDLFSTEIPAEWLNSQGELDLSDEEKAQIEALGGWEKLMETLAERLSDQAGQHHGGSKWIGTGGRSPFGGYGYNPEGVRIGQYKSRHRRAVKVWDKRTFQNLDDGVDLGTRNMKIALRKLRRFARDGNATELDLEHTISATARNAGYLDLKMVAERRNAVKVLLCLDVGGSMDDHVKVAEELFSAARSEFKQLEYFYFHNCIYESVWKDNQRRHQQRTPLDEIIRTYSNDYHLILVGDATMSPYEITQAGGSVEHMNHEPGAIWLQRLLDAYPRTVWLNPQPEAAWEYTLSINIIQQLMSGRMFPLTLAGMDQAIQALKHSAR